MSFTSDIIVGFPSETEEDFEETLKLVEKVRFLNLFTFIYSPRKGTPAAKMEGQLTREDKLRRFKRLIALQNSISTELHAAMVGKTVTVLTEGKAADRPGKTAARTPQNHLVFLNGEYPEGKFVQVTVTSANPWSLEGVILNQNKYN
jgi:tRNA-2-methylthio-N6-dimethylallyladenosine synthase